MSAVVDYAPYAWCHDCAEGSDNAENHEPDDRADEAYDRERDARYDD